MQLNIEEKKEKKNVHIYTRCFVLFLVRSLKNILVGVHDLPDTDEVVSVTGKEVLTISRPGKGDNLGSLGVSRGENKVGLELVNESSLLEVVDLDTRGGGSAEPVSVRREGQSMDLITGGERVKVLVLNEVPEDDVTVLATGSAKRSIRGDSDGGNVTSVANVVSNELGVLDVPNLDKLVPTGRDDGSLLLVLVRRESNGGDPVAVALVVLESVLALTNGVPDLDLTVTAGRDNLSVVGREGDGKNVTVVADKSLEGLAGGKVPKTKSLIPRGRDGVRTVLRDGNILNDVRVTSERSLGDTVGLVITGT